MPKYELKCIFDSAEELATYVTKMSIAEEATGKGTKETKATKETKETKEKEKKSDAPTVEDADKRRAEVRAIVDGYNTGDEQVSKIRTVLTKHGAKNVTTLDAAKFDDFIKDVHAAFASSSESVL